MAFNRGGAQRQETPQNDSWKAQAFLNLYLPTKDGKRTKLGAIPLKTSRHNEAALITWLNEDPTRVAKLVSKLIVEYRSAEPTEGQGFDLADASAE